MKVGPKPVQQFWSMHSHRGDFVNLDTSMLASDIKSKTLRRLWRTPPVPQEALSQDGKLVIGEWHELRDNNQAPTHFCNLVFQSSLFSSPNQ